MNIRQSAVIALVSVGFAVCAPAHAAGYTADCFTEEGGTTSGGMPKLARQRVTTASTSITNDGAADDIGSSLASTLPDPTKWDGKRVSCNYTDGKKTWKVSFTFHYRGTDHAASVTVP